MYLVSAYFDDNTSRILQRYIEKTAEASGNDFMLRNNVPPHMTVSQIEARDPEVLIPAFRSLHGKVIPGEVYFASVGMLLPYVIYTAPVMNQYLQNLSETVYEAFSGVPDTCISRYYRPYSWLPHVTIGKTLDKSQLLAAVKVLQESFAPAESKIVKLGLSRVNPHRDIEELILSIGFISHLF